MEVILKKTDILKPAAALYIYIFLLALTLSGVPALAEDPPAALPDITVVDAAALKKMLDEGEKPLIIDFRLEPEFNKFSLPDSVNCLIGAETDISKETIRKTVKALRKCPALEYADKETKVVAYCKSALCWMSPKGALALVEMGFTDVLWFRNGMREWQEKQFPVDFEFPPVVERVDMRIPAKVELRLEPKTSPEDFWVDKAKRESLPLLHKEPPPEEFAPKKPAPKTELWYVGKWVVAVEIKPEGKPEKGPELKSGLTPELKMEDKAAQKDEHAAQKDEKK
jgi:rhodanese-related sulfurtransferase